MGVNHALQGGAVTVPTGPTASPVLESYTNIFIIGEAYGLRVPYPSGVSAGDLLIVLGATYNGANPETELEIDSNANWTKLFNLQGATDYGGENRMLAAWWKYADGDELDNVGLSLNSVATGLTLENIAVQMLRISGVDGTDPIITPTVDGSVSDGESPFDSPTINAEDYSLVIPVVALTDFNGASDTLSIGNGATVTDEGTSTSSGINKVTLASASKQITTGGATGAFTWSGTDANDHFLSATIGIKGGSKNTFSTPVTDSKFSLVELLVEFGQSAATSVDTSNNAQSWSNLGGSPNFQFWGLGNGGQFQGGGGALDFGNLTNVIPGANEEFCFEMFVLTTSTSMGSGDSYMSIHSPTGNLRCWDLVNWGSLDELTFYYSTDGSSFSSLVGGNNTLTHDQWNHVVVERDASDVIRLIVNGSVLDSVTDGSAFYATTASFLVGGRNGVASSSSVQRISGIRLTLGSGATRYGGAFTYNNATPGWPFPQS